MRKLLSALAAVTWTLSGCAGEQSASVAAIGGGDGPTAVFVTGDPKDFIIAGAVLLGAVVAVIAAVVYFVRKRK